jgi:ribose transport system ATP-binding protein
MTMTVKENLTLAHLNPLRGRAGQLIGSAERQEVKSWIKQTALRPPDPDRQVSLLSGGNQQKVVLAKWLRIKPRVLLLDEPTQGVDVSAKAAIYELVARAADEGSAVLMLSSDTKELTMCCDRVIVMRDGVVAAELVGDEINEARLVAESLGLPHLGDESSLIPQENSTYVSR